MGRSKGLATASTFALALCLAGCGGGGSDPPDPPTGASPPVAVPPPPPPPTSIAPETIGLTQMASFPTLGWAYRFIADSTGSLVQGPAAPLASDRVEFGFHAGTRKHEIVIPGLERSTLDVIQSAGSDYTESILQPAGGVSLFLYRPVPENPIIALAHTSFGLWRERGASAQNRGVFAYGVPTPASEMPTGVTRYRAHVLSVAGAETGGFGSFIQGAGTLEFSNDGSIVGMSGEIGPLVPWQDDFDDRPRNAAFGLTLRTYVAGGPFGGVLSTPDASGPSMFEGFFTGPGAGELLLRFQAPYRDLVTGRTGTLSGVLVAKKI